MWLDGRPEASINGYKVTRGPQRTRFNRYWHSRSGVLRDVVASHGQNSFLVGQNLLLPLFDPRLILKDRIEFCLICEDLNLIAQEPLLVCQQYRLVLENFLYSHESNLHLLICWARS